MLLLGAVAMFEPVNGYQIRRELSSWRVDEWANLKPGSIYHSLGELAEQEFLVRHDVVDGTRQVAVYEVTDAGRTELERTAGGAGDGLPRPRTAFTVAFGMLPLVQRRDGSGHLTTRRVAIERAVEGFGRGRTTRPRPSPRSQGLVLWLDSRSPSSGGCAR